MKTLALMSLFVLTSLNALAAPKTVTLEVPVTFKTKLAVVTFDDEKTTVKALTEATTNAGYPSTLKE